MENQEVQSAGKSHLLINGGIVLGIVILIASLLAYFPDIPIPFTGYVFRLIEPVRRQYAKIVLGVLSWIFMQGILIMFYIWIVKNVFKGVSKIKELITHITEKIESVARH